MRVMVVAGARPNFMKVAPILRALAVTGERLLDHYLPALPRPTGVVFDNGAEHMMSLPPVRGIVSDELAVDA